MTSNINVGYQELESCATQLSTAQQDMISELARLKSMIDNLVQGGFRTDLASGKFQQSYAQWDTGAKNVIQGLEGMSSFLKTTVKEHRDLDDRLSRSTGS
ncbi:type VII secretion protein [Geodermatophilus sp. TF02-6]|uniref:WXG100 family type VII secretion target n=1 Tax=Geodermatophilus sp. TF02-6 TaxID=2250575 RepID=UPI000DE85911|nr:WXG100 family type VII secretion target [Geodermatophilus sp. TF02-6]RBY80898.1 type VII secretion protein [Geodermatophilus sp. TF02-6]